jgi:hypothetical protein
MPVPYSVAVVCCDSFKFVCSTEFTLGGWVGGWGGLQSGSASAAVPVTVTVSQKHWHGHIQLEVDSDCHWHCSDTGSDSDVHGALASLRASLK